MTKGARVPGITGAVLVLATVGRKTGQKRMTPMGYVREGQDKLLVVAEHGARADWVRNALAAGTVDIWIDGVAYEAGVLIAENQIPAAVRGRIRSRLVALANKALSSDSKVVEINLVPGV
ncbi:MAG: nitroreductase family deazaflavin-dependent oxidoreductase [Actinomycetota bacterium]